jgi:methyl-accepting chemotaxis protein
MSQHRRLTVAFALGFVAAALVAAAAVATGLLRLEDTDPISMMVAVALAVAVVAIAVWQTVRVARDTEREQRAIEDAAAAADVRDELEGHLTELAKRVREVSAGGEEAFNSMEEGTRRQSQSASRTYDALGQLREDLVEASEAMGELAIRVGDSSTTVAQMDRTIGRAADMIGGLSASIEQAKTTTRRGDASARRLADDLEDLSFGVSTAADALAEMTAGAEQARNDARLVAENMSSLEAQAARIGEAIESVIQGSDTALGSNQRILEVTASLESRLGGIDDVIEVIRNLAERTKLLSINASIIASEAGEHGRAFAVVAGEVKDLAGSTATAIAEISTALGALKQGFDETVETIQLGQAEVQRGVGLARDAVVVLRAIPEQVHETAVLSDEISDRTERQVIQGRDVGQAIDRMAGALDQVGTLLTEQVDSNRGTLDLYRAIDDSAEQVLRSAHEHAAAASGVSKSVERISGDFRTLADRVKGQLKQLGEVVDLSEEVLMITDSNRRRAEALSALLFEVDRCSGEIERFLGR